MLPRVLGMPKITNDQRPGTLDDLFRFRVAPLAKVRFAGIAGDLGLTPSLLLRKFESAVVEHPDVADRLMTLRRSGGAAIGAAPPEASPSTSDGRLATGKARARIPGGG